MNARSIRLLLAMATVTLGAGMAQAQTAANGPYYAAPSWDQKLQCDTAAACPRFIVLANWNNEAVLDRETGLVWQRSPNSPLTTWFTARIHCLNATTGARKGWRLPSIQELQSLVDPSQPAIDSASLPPGHPFINIRFEPRNPDFYWSATTAADDPTHAFTVLFDGEALNSNFKSAGLGASHGFAWCVRGAGPLDNY